MSMATGVTIAVEKDTVEETIDDNMSGALRD